MVYMGVGMKIIWIVGISLLSGLLGRLGGVGKPWDTKMRDLGVPACWVVSLLVLRVDCPWWGFLAASGLLFGACTTYWDTVFKFDNMWFAGFVVGMAAFPIVLFTGHWWLYAFRALILAVIWGSLNRWLPEHILFWHRDTVEEFCRYAVVILTCWLI
jgi:hypothetical protein